MKNEFFSEINYRFGFGCMRMDMADEHVDYEKFGAMVDYCMEQGFNYFDTAHGYLNGQSEIAIKECLSSKYPRDSFVLTNKLSHNFFEKEEDIRPLFDSQLRACGVEYFDFYLMHAQNASFYEKYKKCNAYETAIKLKDEGKIKHFGISFHDRADVLDKILCEYPQVEVVQIQFNYVDYLDEAGVQARMCYEVCKKHGKPVIVMEPVKGGTLERLPEEAAHFFDEIGRSGSNASYALRYVLGFDNIFMVLSGMSSMEMVRENIALAKNYTPLNETEINAISKVCGVFRSKDIISCTACRYCTEGCPQNISIPDLFACLNAKKMFGDWNSDWYYSVHTNGKGKASDCIKCGMCEGECPQNLNIRDLLEEVANTFDKKKLDIED